jgi:hypothetical protein
MSLVAVLIFVVAVSASLSMPLFLRHKKSTGCTEPATVNDSISRGYHLGMPSISAGFS